MEIDNRVLVAICLCLFFVSVFCLQHFTTETDNIISGFWNVSEEFKEQAKIDNLMLYFDEGEGYDYNGYMVMVVDGETVFNETMKFRIRPKGYFKSLEYEFEMEKDTKVMPKRLSMNILPNSGLMELKCLEENKVYARLFKDNQLSAKTILSIGDDKDDSEDL